MSQRNTIFTPFSSCSCIYSQIHTLTDVFFFIPPAHLYTVARGPHEEGCLSQHPPPLTSFLPLSLSSTRFKSCRLEHTWLHILSSPPFLYISPVRHRHGNAERDLCPWRAVWQSGVFRVVWRGKGRWGEGSNERGVLGLPTQGDWAQLGLATARRPCPHRAGLQCGGEENRVGCCCHTMSNQYELPRAVGPLRHISSKVALNTEMVCCFEIHFSTSPWNAHIWLHSQVVLYSVPSNRWILKKRTGTVLTLAAQVVVCCNVPFYLPFWKRCKSLTQSEMDTLITLEF